MKSFFNTLSGGIFMNTARSFNIPKALLPYQSLIRANTLLCAKLSFSNSPSSYTGSKLGGIPFLDPYSSIPKDKYGMPMSLLAQINFEEFDLEPPFPQNGILQFFIDQQFGNTQLPKESEEFIIKYIHPPKETNTPLPNQEVIPMHPEFPILRELTVSSETVLDPVSSLDFRYQYSYPKEINSRLVTEDERTFEEVYFEKFLGADPKIGGYPYFIHNDFRIANPAFKKYDTLLLQILTDDLYDIIYRDSGIISFFISTQDLTNLNFSNVYMHTEEY